MHEKISVLVLYGVLGLVLALSPTLARIRPTAGTSALALPRRGLWTMTPVMAVLCTVLLAIFTHARISSPFFVAIACLAAGIAVFSRSSKRDALHAGAATLLACTVSATLPWWRRQGVGLEISPGELLGFVVLLAGTTAIFLASRVSAAPGKLQRMILLGTYAAIVAGISYSTAAMVDSDAMLTLWHHWGAYIDPAEAVMGGARLLHDIPAQYGAGPTLMLSGLCGADCWVATYWVVSTATFAYALVIGAIAWHMAAGAFWRNVVILLLCVAACMFWNAYPPAVSSPNLTPSTSGMRFLPVVLLVAWVVLPTNLSFQRRNIGGHLLWILGAAWSPESLFYVTAVWWSVYAFDSTTQAQATNRLLCLAYAGARLFVLALGTVTVICIVYYLAYDVLPVPRAFIAYALYPPGPLPINPYGTIWYFAYAMVLSVSVARARLRLTGDTQRFRRSLALQLLAFSTFSYYLGRSHDNNLLNLAPFLMLVLLDALENAKGSFVRHSLAIMLASLLAWGAVFGWGTWREAWTKGGNGRIRFFCYARQTLVRRSGYRVGPAAENSWDFQGSA